LISEYPLNTPSLKQYFPWRNRIISGLSLGVLIIEAPLKSGALITAHFALEQNREIFAVPGSIFNQKSSGCHLLIKNGAKLVEKAEDIIEDLIYYHPGLKEKIKNLSPQNNSFQTTLTNKEKQVLDILSCERPVSLDKILEKINLKTTEVLSILSELELKGLVKENQGLYTKIYNQK
ncbi:MAG: DNA-processing protein DprA, partial [Minisyncoccia bacterium]